MTDTFANILLGRWEYSKFNTLNLVKRLIEI